MSTQPNVNKQVVRYAQQEYVVGDSRDILGSDRIQSQIIKPPFVTSKEQRNRVVLDRISVTLNQRIGATTPVLPATVGSLRAYFVPYTGAVCEIEESTDFTLKFQTLARLPGRIPVVGWYPGDIGPRELNDTNFGEGHCVPRSLGGDWYALALLSAIPSALSVDENFNVQLTWRSEPLKDNGVWSA